MGLDDSSTKEMLFGACSEKFSIRIHFEDSQKHSLGGGCLVIKPDVQFCLPLSLHSPALSCHNEKLSRVTKSKTVLLHGIFSVKRASCCKREEASPGRTAVPFAAPRHMLEMNTQEYTTSSFYFLMCLAQMPKTATSKLLSRLQ